MPKLTYWAAQCRDDNDCYSIVGKTKKSVIEQVASNWSPESYDTPVKCVVEYRDAFDLMDKLTDEGGGRTAYQN